MSDQNIRATWRLQAPLSRTFTLHIGICSIAASESAFHRDVKGQPHDSSSLSGILGGAVVHICLPRQDGKTKAENRCPTYLDLQDILYIYKLLQQTYIMLLLNKSTPKLMDRIALETKDEFGLFGPCFSWPCLAIKSHTGIHAPNIG